MYLLLSRVLIIAEQCCWAKKPWFQLKSQVTISATVNILSPSLSMPVCCLPLFVFLPHYLSLSPSLSVLTNQNKHILPCSLDKCKLICLSWLVCDVYRETPAWITARIWWTSWDVPAVISETLCSSATEHWWTKTRRRSSLTYVRGF